MSAIAERAGLARAGLDKGPRAPSRATTPVLKVLNSLGVKLTVSAA